MITPILTWFFIIGAMMLVFSVNAIIAFANVHKCRNHRHFRIVEFGRQRDMFFIPGDPKDEKYKDFEYDDVEDL